MFQDKLRKYNIEPKLYLDVARKRAYSKGYDPSLLHFSRDSKKKLCYGGIDFGASGYKDYILYTLIEPDKADSRREAYWKRALRTAMETDNKYSPANLSLHILW